MTTMLPPPFDVLMDVSLGDGTRIEDLPPELLGNRLKPEFWIADDEDPLTSRASQNLPSIVAGARLEGIPVLFGWLEGEPAYGVIDDSLRRYRNQAAIARSWLDADAANLQLFLAAPSGNADDPAWQELAAHIEADDRVCRKLVWLPSAGSLRQSATAFLARTFLASPWTVAAKPEVSRLDSISNLNLPEGWDEVVSDPSLDADNLVQRLTEAPSE